MSFNKETNMYEGYIYKIVNDVNNKVYIGQTTQTLHDRWHGHMSAALQPHRTQTYLYKAMRHYGREHFHMEPIIQIQDSSEQSLIHRLDALEQQFIREYQSLSYQSGYNIELGGRNKIVDGRKVHKYNLALEYLDTYRSCEEAGRQNGIDGCTIYSACQHIWYTAGGFIWAFDGEQPMLPPYCCNIDLERIQSFEHSSTDDPKTKVAILKTGILEPIDVYNAFGELVITYDNIIEAAKAFNVNIQQIKLNITGKVLQLNKRVLRLHGDSFDKFPRSKSLQPITVYDMTGQVIKHCETIRDAEVFVGSPSGEVTRAINRGGSCKGYMFSYYGEPLTRKLRRMYQPMEMYDQNMQLIQTFPSKKEVAIFFSESLESSFFKKSDFTLPIEHKGYYWKYPEEFPINA